MQDQPNNQPPVIPASPVVSPQEIRHAVGEDPFTKIMEATQPVTVVERPQPIVPAQTANAPLVTPGAQTSAQSNITPEQATELVKESLSGAKPSEEENLKALRKTNKEILKEKEQKEQELVAARERLQKFEAGEEIAEPVKQREAKLKEEVEKLKPYEQLHALKMSDEYEEKFVKPLDEIGNRAIKLAEDYEVDPQVITQASRIENKRERNAFLKKHLDDVGVFEMTALIDQASVLKAEQRNAEAAPAQTLETLQANKAEARRQEEERRVSSLNRNAKTGMERALEKIKTTEYPEFQFTGDEKQDEYARGILDAATKSFSDTVKLLAAQGIKELPEEAAELLAETFLYGHAGTVAMASRNDHYRRAEEIKENARRESNGIRPQIGRGSPFSGGSAEPAPRGPRTGEQMAEDLLRSVGLKG